MSKIVIYPEEPCLIPVYYPSSPLEVYNKEYADIEEVLMCFKIDNSEPEDKYIVKYWKDGNGVGSESGDVLINESENTFTLVKQETDILPVNQKSYKVFIGVKVTGLSKMLWLRVSDHSLIRVEPDGISI